MSNNAITTLESIWDSNESMRVAVDMATYLAKAQVIPQAYQDKPGDCLVAIDLGKRMGVSPVIVMQNSQVVYGNLTWKGSACRALIDGSGRFENSRYEFTGKPGQLQWGCRLVAENARTKKTVCGPWVTMQMAKDEGWLDKKGSKWPTMPELMMRYRAAAFFARTECPEVLMGFQTTEEAMDIQETTQAPEIVSQDALPGSEMAALPPASDQARAMPPMQETRADPVRSEVTRTRGQMSLDSL